MVSDVTIGNNLMAFWRGKIHLEHMNYLQFSLKHYECHNPDSFQKNKNVP